MKKTCTKNDILSELYQVVLDRRQRPADASYVSALLRSGGANIRAKISEEAAELTDASAAGSRGAVIHEMADLWFHCLVLLGHHEISPGDIFNELLRRRGVSGLAEKESRNNNAARD
jgi:phosphoribosyl-ATP pyrophosphohydrolase